MKKSYSLFRKDPLKILSRHSEDKSLKFSLVLDRMQLTVARGCYWQTAGCRDARFACAGGVAAILAALLRDGSAPQGLGPVCCISFGSAAVFSLELAEAVTPFTTSVVYG